MDMNQAKKLLPYMITFFFLMLTTCKSSDTIVVHQNISDGGDTIVSANAIFELGFFSLGNSKNRYLGIWFKKTSPFTFAWVANRETPLMDTSGAVKLDNQGNLTLVNGRGKVFWSSNSSASGIKLGKNFLTGRETYLTSWRSADDPSPGEYTLNYQMVKGKFQQLYIRKLSVIETRIGPFDGITFSGRPLTAPDSAGLAYLGFMVVNQNEMYFVENRVINATTILVRTVISPGGKLEIFQQTFPNQEWIQSVSLPVDYCDNYGVCGPYGSCNIATSPNCLCLKGFEKNSNETSPGLNDTSVCRRRIALDCGRGEGFLKFSSMKLPDTENAVFNANMSL